MQAIAGDQIPSIPNTLRVLLLGQTQSVLDDDLERLPRNRETVLQHVIKSNKRRERLLNEESLLSVALEQVRSPTAAVEAYRSVSHDRLVQQVHEARQIQLRRSGARGAKARKSLLELEDELKESENRFIPPLEHRRDISDIARRLRQPPQDIDTAEISQGTRQAANLLAEVQTSLELV